MSEIWKPVIGYEGYYEVSSTGNIRSVDRTIIDKRGRKIRLKSKILKQEKAGYNLQYLAVNLSKDGEIIHRETHTLIAKAFLGEKPNGTEICHNDGKGSNNKIDNLRYDTPQANHKDSVKPGVFQFGETAKHSKLTDNKVRKIRKLYSNGQSMRRIGFDFNVSGGTIRKIIMKQTWKHVI